MPTGIRITIGILNIMKNSWRNFVRKMIKYFETYMINKQNIQLNE